MEKIVLPNGPITIGNQAFLWCRKLVSANLGRGAVSIGEETFRECQSLHSLTVPESLTNIGKKAFVDCNAFSIVYYRGTKKQWKKVKIDKKQKGNLPLLKAEIKFNYIGE